MVSPGHADTYVSLTVLLMTTTNSKSLLSKFYLEWVLLNNLWAKNYFSFSQRLEEVKFHAYLQTVEQIYDWDMASMSIRIEQLW